MRGGALSARVRSAPPLTSQKATALRAATQAMDGNGDREISWAEFQAASLSSCGPMWDHETCARTVCV